MISHYSVLGFLPTKSIFSRPPETEKDFPALKNLEFVAFIATCNGERLAELLLQSNLVSQADEQFPALSPDLLRETIDTVLFLHLFSSVGE